MEEASRQFFARDAEEKHAAFQGGASPFYPDAATSISIATVCDASNAGRLSQRVWGMDDANVCHWYRAQGGRCGYVTRLTANHYETTSGQHARYPEYFARTLAEGKPSL